MTQPRVGAVVLAPLLLGAALYCRAQPQERDAWPGRRQARALAEQLGTTPTGTSLAKLVAALDRDPADIAASRSLRGLVSEAYLSGLSRVTAAGGVLALSREDSALHAALYRFLMGQIGEEVLQSSCHQGFLAFNEGNLLLATDRFHLCLLLKPEERWLHATAKAYLSSFLPRAVEHELRRMPEALREPYRSAQRDLARGEWTAALPKLKRCAELARSRAGKARGGGEAGELAGRLQRRLRPEGCGGDPENFSRRIRELFSRVPIAAASTAEACLYRSLASRDAREERAAREALRWVYSNLGITRALGEARLADPSRDRQAGKPLPGQTPEAGPGDARAADAPGTAAREPNGKPWWDQVEAEARYNSGLRSYLLGNLEEAQAHWRAALDILGSHEKSRRALQRVMLEIEAARPAP